MSRVSNTLKQALLLWSMLLVLALWLGFNQASTAMKFGVTVALIVIAVGLLACWRGKKRQTEADSAWLSRLPPKTYRQPVVLVCGDAAASLFTENPLRQVAGGLYLHIADEEQLIRQAEVLLADRPAWASQLCVACTVVPVVHLDMAVLAGRLRRFVGGLATVRRRAGIKVPLLLWSWLPGTGREDDLPWFICAGGKVQVVTPAGESSPTAWAAQPGTDGSSLRLCHLLRMESLRQWLNQMVLPELNGYPPLAAGMGQAPSLPALEGNLWQTWTTAKTGLTPEAIPKIGASPLPFPDMMLPLLPRQSGFTPVRRACVAALLMTTVAGVAALCLSATANRSLLLQVSDDLHKYDAVPADNDAAKAHHLSVLKDDANILDSYFREGEPLRLSLGLYPGERLRQPVWRVIRDYRPPEKKRDVADALPVQSVRLDSMALFDVGQARLKDGSTKVLINALVNIRARPGWLIVVTGYTDTTGNKKANQQLSLRRAEAVRDWMLQTSDIPATCFAVQGLGESHPAATNDTPEGRAANRRVEISLVPRTDACQDVKQNMLPEPALSQLNPQGVSAS